MTSTLHIGTRMRWSFSTKGRWPGTGNRQDILTPDCIRSVYGVDSFVVENDCGRFIVPFRARKSV